MALSLGALSLLGSGIGATGGLASSALQFFGNRFLQEDMQDFNSLEAAINRAFNAQEASIARDFTAQENALNRAFNAEQAQLARDFEATKYQRTVNDMKAAGLNPAAIGMSGLPSAAPVASGSSGAFPSASSGAASGGSNSISNPMLGNILSTAFEHAVTDTLKNDRFAAALGERTAWHAHKMRIDSQREKPDWVKKYEENFEKDVVDL